MRPLDHLASEPTALHALSAAIEHVKKILGFIQGFEPESFSFVHKRRKSVLYFLTQILKEGDIIINSDRTTNIFWVSAENIPVLGYSELIKVGFRKCLCVFWNVHSLLRLKHWTNVDHEIYTKQLFWVNIWAQEMILKGLENQSHLFVQKP